MDARLDPMTTPLHLRPAVRVLLLVAEGLVEVTWMHGHPDVAVELAF